MRPSTSSTGPVGSALVSSHSTVRKKHRKQVARVSGLSTGYGVIAIILGPLGKLEVLHRDDPTRAGNGEVHGVAVLAPNSSV